MADEGGDEGDDEPDYEPDLADFDPTRKGSADKLALNAGRYFIIACCSLLCRLAYDPLYYTRRISWTDATKFCSVVGVRSTLKAEISAC